MTTPLHIRPAHTDDIDALIILRRTAILILAAPKMGKKNATDWAHAATPTRVRHAIEVHQVWVADLAGEPAGWVEVDGNRIEALYVHPRQAQQGIGSLLLAHAEQHISAAGHPAALLNASWNAEPFYLKRGYKPQGARSLITGLPMRKALVSA